jgi:transglutaminase-like putative cysteine protease
MTRRGPARSSARRDETDEESLDWNGQEEPYAGGDQRHDHEHRRILHEVLSTQEDSKEMKKALPFARILLILLTFLVLLSFLFWAVPDAKTSPHPRQRAIPALDEVLSPGTELLPRPTGTGTENIGLYVNSQDPAVKLAAARIVGAACARSDDRCHAEALFLFVRDNIKYVPDPLGEYYETPRETLLAGSADCDGQAILLASLLRSVGIETKFTFSPNHVVVEAWAPRRGLFSGDTNQWLYLDATCDTCTPGEKPNGVDVQ